MIDIVVVNWNSGSYLECCLKTIETPEVQSVIVVDNNSSDGSCNFISEDDRVTLVKLKENIGFGAACNIGASKSNSEYILFLNPDAALYGNTIQGCISLVRDDINSNVGIFGVQLVDECGHVTRSCSRFPRSLSFLFHALALDKLFHKLGSSMLDWEHDKTQDVDQVIGAFFLVRRILFETLGGFDERFFVYFEEVDFSYRARQAGWRSVYLADVQAFHAGGGTSNQVKAKRLFYSLRSRLLYAFKHFSLIGAMLVLLSTILLEPISRSALAIVRRSWSSFCETWSGYGLLFRWLPQWIFKGVTR